MTGGGLGESTSPHTSLGGDPHTLASGMLQHSGFEGVTGARVVAGSRRQRRLEGLTFVGDEAVIVLWVAALLDQDVNLLPLQLLS